MGLVYYPTTIAPVNRSASVTTRCADNAHKTSSSLSISCTSSGSWSGSTPQCQCDTGYHAVIVSGRQICQTEGNLFSAFLQKLFAFLTGTTTCEARNVGLFRYPTTLAPAGGSVTVTTQCADNAHISNSTSLNVTCNSSGSWSGETPQCRCDEGYHSILVGHRHVKVKSYS